MDIFESIFSQHWSVFLINLIVYIVLSQVYLVFKTWIKDMVLGVLSCGVQVIMTKPFRLTIKGLYIVLNQLQIKIFNVQKICFTEISTFPGLLGPQIRLDFDVLSIR